MLDEPRNRRAALDGLAKILDAGALEELFTGPEEEAVFLYDLLLDAAKGRASTYYWEICRTARRRGVSPEFVIDRASVLLATMVERRRTDLYRILGVPPLSSADTIRRRWLEMAKLHHPDVGGDPAAFRHAKQAYDVLSDAARRSEYERFWLRAHGPFERVAPPDRDTVPARPIPLEPAEASPAETANGRGVEEAPAPAAAPALDSFAVALAEATEVLRAGAALDRRMSAPAGGTGLAAFLDRVRTALAAVETSELDALRARAEAAIRRLEDERRVLAELAAIRHALEPVRLAS